MKKQLMIGLLAAFASVSVYAADACTGKGADDKEVLESEADGTKFVRVPGQKIKCSANVLATYDQSATALWVGAASKKGKNSFKGNTAGGAVKVHALCEKTSGCEDGDVTAATAQAAIEASAT